MARIARLVVPHHPHHVTQRGDQRRVVFENDEDYALYLDILRVELRRTDTEMWCYCLLPDHVHMVLFPKIAEGLSSALRETHRRYSTVYNARRRLSGKLFQSRFSSIVLDDVHLVKAVRYDSLNPVRARLVPSAQDWPWSSVRAHLLQQDDPFVFTAPVLDLCGGAFETLLHPQASNEEFAALRGSEKTGRPLGSEQFLDRIANLTGRDARPKKRGRKKKVLLEG